MGPPACRAATRGGRVLLLVTTALVIFGTIFVASASEGQSAANGGISLFDHDPRPGLSVPRASSRSTGAPACDSSGWSRAPRFLSVGSGLLLAVKAVGVTANGGKRWLDLRVIDLQPSELFKLCCVLFIAWLVATPPRRAESLGPACLWTAPVSLGCGLIVLEPDIGTARWSLVIVVAMLAVAGLVAATARSVVVAARGCRGRRVLCCAQAVLGEAILLLPASQLQPARQRLPAAAVQDRPRRRRERPASGSATAERSGDCCLTRTPTSSSRSSARNSASIGALAVHRPLHRFLDGRGAHRPAVFESGATGWWPSGSPPGSRSRRSSISRRWSGGGPSRACRCLSSRTVGPRSSPNSRPSGCSTTSRTTVVARRRRDDPRASLDRFRETLPRARPTRPQERRAVDSPEPPGVLVPGPVVITGGGTGWPRLSHAGDRRSALRPGRSSRTTCATWAVAAARRRVARASGIPSRCCRAGASPFVARPGCRGQRRCGRSAWWRRW